MSKTVHNHDLGEYFFVFLASNILSCVHFLQSLISFQL